MEWQKGYELNQHLIRFCFGALFMAPFVFSYLLIFTADFKRRVFRKFPYIYLPMIHFIYLRHFRDFSELSISFNIILFLPFLIVSRKEIGLLILASGAILNSLVILLNDGRMPVLFDRPVQEGALIGIFHKVLSKNTSLPFLADRIKIYGCTASVGDLLFFFGLVAILIKETIIFIKRKKAVREYKEFKRLIRGAS